MASCQIGACHRSISYCSTRPNIRINFRIISSSLHLLRKHSYLYPERRPRAHHLNLVMDLRGNNKVARCDASAWRVSPSPTTSRWTSHHLSCEFRSRTASRARLDAKHLATATQGRAALLIGFQKFRIARRPFSNSKITRAPARLWESPLPFLNLRSSDAYSETEWITRLRSSVRKTQSMSWQWAIWLKILVEKSELEGARAIGIARIYARKYFNTVNYLLNEVRFKFVASNIFNSLLIILQAIFFLLCLIQIVIETNFVKLDKAWPRIDCG